MNMVVKTASFGINGIDGYLVEVEAAAVKGFPRIDLVGLPDAAVKESKDRVTNAMQSCNLTIPDSHITFNLAPADIRKEGPIYDLPIAVNLMLLSGAIRVKPTACAFVGELSLSGEVRGVNGVLPMTIKARELGYRRMFVPLANSAEAAVVDGIEIYAVKNILELRNMLNGLIHLEPAKPSQTEKSTESGFVPDFSQVKGQYEAKRAMEIAAAGSHNILLIGPPGSGKSMLAKRVPSILPDMSFEEMIETTKIHSIAGALHRDGLITVGRCRSPNHSVTAVGLGGGGTGGIRPGEVSLAHNGVLFLDELPEFTRSALEVLRQPIEDSRITISRAGQSCTYPCSIMVVAAMNPCPCGYYGDETHQCTCSPRKISNYLNKISGPLLDRFDIHVEVPPVKFDELRSDEVSECSAEIKKRVDAARDIQRERFKNSKTTSNSRINAAELSQFCLIDKEAEKVLRDAFEKLNMTARAYDRVLKVARTVADLEQSEIIRSYHVLEAVQYRSLDRKYWNT